MISVNEAEALIALQSLTQQSESLDIERAVGRKLAVDIVADRDGPPFDRVAMDGFAIEAQEGGPLEYEIRGLQLAGTKAIKNRSRFHAVEVATGAVLPLGTNCVIPYEKAKNYDKAVMSLHEVLAPYANVHRRGEDFKALEVLIACGTEILSPHVHILASVGLKKVSVIAPPKFSFIATGDEIVSIKTIPKSYQIRRSNTYAMSAEADAWGIKPSFHGLARDKSSSIENQLLKAVEASTIVVLTGGVSKGAKDLIPEVLDDLGFETIFHEVRQKPGKPLLFAKHHSGKLVFGLPGNPVSSLFAFRRYVLPLLLNKPELGQSVVSLDSKVVPKIKTDFTHFLPVKKTEKGIELLDFSGSGNYFGISQTTGFIEVTRESTKSYKYFAWGTK